MKKVFLFLLITTVSFQVNAQTDKQLVTKACMNYLEGFYEGNTDKLKASLKPTLHKFGFWKSEKTNKYGKASYMTFEGALKLVAANAHFTGQEITPPFIRECLKDLLALHEKQVSIDNIQRTVAEYYKIKVADLLSKRRTRSITRPRQVAMALSKELTNHSLPEIGDAFGGRDHTTVLHACKKIVELQETDPSIREDYQNFLRTLTT